MSRSLSGAGLCFLIGAGMISAMRCQPSPPPSATTTTGGGPSQTYSRASLKLEAVPYEKGVLIMGGTPYKVKLETKKGGKEDEFSLLIKLDKEDTLIEEERYYLTDAVFQYVGSGNESFDPPLNLISFPMKVPSTDTWNGSFVWGTTKLEASAEVSTKADPLNLASGKVDDAVLILAKVAIKEASGNVANQEFKFWVAPDRGVIRRDFAATSSREPEGAPPAE